MQISLQSPGSLVPNSWNPNVVDPINMDKLAESLKSDGLQKAILIRTLPDGSKEILDGVHRVSAAISLGWEEIACIDVGVIPDGEAKKATLIGNSRYGDDDPLLMSNLLSDSSIGSAEDLLATLPFDEATLTSYFSHQAMEFEDFDSLLPDESSDLNLTLPDQAPTKSHQILRFKLSIEDSVTVTDLITRAKHEQGFTESDDLTNAGDALVFLLCGGARD